jgi:hypothetical protein
VIYREEHKGGLLPRQETYRPIFRILLKQTQLANGERLSHQKKLWKISVITEKSFERSGGIRIYQLMSAGSQSIFASCHPVKYDLCCRVSRRRSHLCIPYVVVELEVPDKIFSFWSRFRISRVRQTMFFNTNKKATVMVSMIRSARQLKIIRVVNILRMIGLGYS